MKVKHLKKSLVALSIGAMASTGMVAVAGASYTPNPPVPPNVTPTNFTSSSSATIRVGDSAYFAIGTNLKPGTPLTYTLKRQALTINVPESGQVVFYVSALTGPSLSVNGGTVATVNYGQSQTLKISGTTASNGSYSGTVSLTATRPLKAPGAPRHPEVMPGDGQNVLSWDAPNQDGGSPITGYVVNQSTDGGANWASTSCSGLSLGCTVTGLTNGTAYRYRIAAVNAVGQGAWSHLSLAKTPRARPDAPADVTAVKQGRNAVVSWNTPASNGGLPIVRYVVTASPGGNTCTYRVPKAGPPINQCTVRGMASGVSYTFSVVAVTVLTSLPATSDPVQF